jgi:hypothetical protein
METPILGIVSQHPRYTDEKFDPLEPCRYFIRSAPFAERFSTIDETTVFALLRSKCSWRKYGPIADDDGGKHVFQLEAFHNRHETLGVLVYKEQLKTKITVPGRYVGALK